MAEKKGNGGAKIWLQAYCHENLGDDLFVRIITDRYPRCRFYLMSNGDNRQLRGIPNLTILPETLPRKVLRKLNASYVAYGRKIRACDVTVLIGGSMFIEGETWQKKFAWHQALVKKARRFCVIGSNFGPYKSDAYYQNYRRLFARMDDCCFRDERTWGIFRDLTNTRWAPDIAFTAQRAVPVRKDGRSLVISVVNLKRKAALAQYYPAYLEAVRKVAREFMSAGWTVTLLSFCREEGDLQCCQEICAELREKPGVMDYCGNLDEMLEAIASAEYVLATRFHSMILGWLFDCKVFPLVYDEKMENVLNDFGLGQLARTVKQAEGLNMREVLDNARRLPDRGGISARAEQQFAYLDEIVIGAR